MTTTRPVILRINESGHAVAFFTDTRNSDSLESFTLEELFGRATWRDYRKSRVAVGKAENRQIEALTDELLASGYELREVTRLTPLSV